uniref:Polyglutamine-binding protein 1 n=1 Tax=Parascaris univalens TaxID=6257 RepID=A0A915A965_PARUN
MPLPPALLARLKRRGIVREDANEEVIAENYDAEGISSHPVEARASADKNTAFAPACPNKYNPYHYCVQFCYDHWKEGISEDSLPKKYTEQRLKILKKYPLPTGWKEVYDPGCARHYYWFLRTDEVSWLPPRHPLAVIGDAAPKVSKELFEKKENTNGVGIEAEKEEEHKEKEAERGGEEEARKESTEKNEVKETHGHDRDGNTKRDDRSRRKRRGSDSADSENENRLNGTDSDEERRPELSDRDRLKRAKRKGIDPMDPAAYGDSVPIGTWSTGLHAHDRTGADVTASGPLFQQRPYPAPGAVLRRQQQDQDRDD